MKQSYYTTPRTLAECTFVTGHGSEQIKPSREWAMYAAFLGGVFFTLFGWHAIAVIWG